MKLGNLLARAEEFEAEAHEILGRHEMSKSRIVHLDATYKQLEMLNVKQEELLRQSLTCAERSCFRASHVMAWCSLMDYLHEIMMMDDGQAVRGLRQKWAVKTPEDLREIASDYQIIELARQMNLCTRTEEKALHGLLNRRNECAHPTEYYPGLNETLGFVSEICARLKTLEKRHISRTS